MANDSGARIGAEFVSAKYGQIAALAQSVLDY